LRRSIKIYLLWLTKKRNPVLGTGKGKRDKQQKTDRLNSDKKRKNPSWDGTSGHPQKKGLKSLYFES
jgi:hypothetical protein